MPLQNGINFQFTSLAWQFEGGQAKAGLSTQGEVHHDPHHLYRSIRVAHDVLLASILRGVSPEIASKTVAYVSVDGWQVRPHPVAVIVQNLADVVLILLYLYWSLIVS